MSTDTFPPMPALDCPSWCDRDRDHEADWQRHVTVGRDETPIHMADGRVLRSSDTPEDEWLACFEPFHLRTLARLPFTGREYAEIDLQRTEGAPSLYLEVEAGITADQARALAAELLKAADMLEQVTGSPAVRNLAPAGAQNDAPDSVVLDDRGQVADLGGYSPRNR